MKKLKRGMAFVLTLCMIFSIFTNVSVAQAATKKNVAKTVTVKTQKELEKAQKLVAENSRLLNRTKVTAKFVEAGIKEESYSSLIDDIVSDDESKSLQFAENLIKAFSANAAAAAEAAKQEAMQTPPPAPGGTVTPVLTAQEQYDKAASGGSILDVIKAADALNSAKNGNII